jgi:CBS-domain-containing membrane protein
MTTSTPNRMTPLLVLRARTAADLMTPDPKSLRQDATVAEAAAFLSTRVFSTAPVIDEAGRPVGVISQADLLYHHGRKAVRLLAAPLGNVGTGAEPSDSAPVQGVMTPAVFCVHTDTPAAKLVDKMLALNVRRLFVVDDAGVLVGVVSAFDVLRGLGRQYRTTT